jgi:hypothetical protein
MIVILASHWRKMLLARKLAQPFIIMAFGLAWLQTLLMQDTAWLPLPAKSDPRSRVAGWEPIASRLDDLRESQKPDVLIADAYKEASIFSYYLPHKDFIYTLRHSPPANQYDLWPGYADTHPKRALWITAANNSPQNLARDFNTITWIERDIVTFRGKRLREYDVYLCENKPTP